jgi:3-hydroxyisobutyrate dehydrogenase-like beta-hydroxyacid dehydrogenase
MRVAVLGLGLMGRPIAHRLLDAGYELTVYNRTQARTDELVALGVRRAATPAEAWENADVCITMVADGKALEALTLGADGLLLDPADGTILVDMSTVAVDASRRVADAAAVCGVSYLRAPVTGNPTVVTAGNLGIMVSGDEEAFRRVEELLRAIGPNVWFLGSAEEARVMKLALNTMIAGTAELMAEALVLGEANGLDRAQMLEVMGQSAVGSPFVKYKTAALVANDYSTTFSSAMMYKDLALALECANGAGVPLPVAACIQQLVRGCMSSGMADLDLMALVLRLEREAGRESLAELSLG